MEVVHYDSYEQFERAKVNAKNLHVAMLDEQLLYFPMDGAEWKIGHLQCEHRWIELSARIFHETFVWGQMKNALWPDTQAYYLLCTIKSALKLVLPFCANRRDRHRKVFEISALRNAVIQVIHDWMGVDEEPAPVEYLLDIVYPPTPPESEHESECTLDA